MKTNNSLCISLTLRNTFINGDLLSCYSVKSFRGRHQNALHVVKPIYKICKFNLNPRSYEFVFKGRLSESAVGESLIKRQVLVLHQPNENPLANTI